MNYIFGSGIVGMLAKEILPDWTIVPFSRSRFFSFKCPLDDNFIIRHPNLDEIVYSIAGQVGTAHYRRIFSSSGLLCGYNPEVFQLFLEKVFGDAQPAHAKACMPNRMEHDIYRVRLNELYQTLQFKHKDHIDAEVKKGKVTAIGDHFFIQNGVRYDFEHAVSTIPLDVTCDLAHINHNFQYLDTHYIHLATKSIDLEGANQALVVDRSIPFFKVVNVAEDQYVLYSTEDFVMPGMVLAPIIPKFEIIDGCCVPKSVNLGPLPDVTFLEERGIYPVGGYAQWDWCSDVGSNILRLLQYLNSGFANTRRKL